MNILLTFLLFGNSIRIQSHNTISQMFPDNKITGISTYSTEILHQYMNPHTILYQPHKDARWTSV